MLSDTPDQLIYQMAHQPSANKNQEIRSSCRAVTHHRIALSVNSAIDHSPTIDMQYLSTDIA